MREAVADRAGRHRLQPQALHRLLGLRVLRDQAENQLAFAPGVAGVDQAVDVFALEQLGQHLQARFALRDRIQVEMRRNDRQIGETPFAALDVVFLGRRDFEQVADGGRKHVVVAFVVLVVLGEAAQRARDVVRDGRLLGDDQGFGHDSIMVGDWLRAPVWDPLTPLYSTRQRAARLPCHIKAACRMGARTFREPRRRPICA